MELVLTVCVCFPNSFNQKLTLTHQQMSVDYDKLRAEESDKSSKLQELMSVSSSANNKASPQLTQDGSSANLAGKTHKNHMNSVQQQQQQHQQPCRRPARTKSVSQAAAAAVVASVKSTAPPLSLFGTLCHKVPLAMPTLQLHLLISLTLVWLTHRCPQYLIVL